MLAGHQLVTDTVRSLGGHVYHSHDYFKLAHHLSRSRRDHKSAHRSCLRVPILLEETIEHRTTENPLRLKPDIL